jgi:uncharacterized protein
MDRDTVERLASHAALGHDASDPQVFETHISWVVAAGPRAYKIKKPVKLDFLDFSTLELRRSACEVEVELNRRFSPDLYEGVVAIGGTPRAPRLVDSGEAFEYAVRMHRFEQSARLDRVMARGELGLTQIDAFAAELTAFQEQSPPITNGDCGSHEVVRGQILEALGDARRNLPDGATRAAAPVERWCRHALTAVGADIARRIADGRIRDGHGDLHLGNLVLLEDRIRMFDCLEFSPVLRRVDVASEVAFLAMDFDARGRPDLGNHFLNAWLEHSGDFGALRVLRLYRVYRAVVRARVAALRAQQCEDPAGRRESIEEAERYFELAQGYTRGFENTPLVITCGLSGSGKSHVAGALSRACAAVRIRSDAERRRLFPAGPVEGVGRGRYGPKASERTYTRLLNLCRIALGAGYPVIVDAAFLRRTDRHLFRNLASTLGVPFRILHVQADPAVLERRVAAKAGDARDPSEATLEVLAHQRSVAAPPAGDEQASTVTVATDREVDIRALARRLLRKHVSTGAHERHTTS